MVDPSKPDAPAPRARPPYTRRQIVSQVTIAAVILISGIGIGTGGTVLVLKDRIIWQPPRRFDPNERGGRPPFEDPVKMWQTEYGLTDDQVVRAKEAFAASWANTRKIFDDTGQKMEAEKAKFAESMKTILTPDQYQKWEQDFKERAERMRRWHPGPGGRPGGPPGMRKDGRRDRGPFPGNRGFQPPLDHEVPPGEQGLPPAPGQPGSPESAPRPE